MENVQISFTGRKMTIEIDLDHEVRESGRGNMIVANTSNWENVTGPEGENLTLNMALVVRRPKKGGRY